MDTALGTILVPHDFSRFADQALRSAARLAGRRGRLIVLHVAGEYGNEVVQRNVIERARRELARRVRAARLPGGRVEAQVVVGDPYREIARAATKVDAIVMCTRGRGGIAHLVIGSVAEKVVRHAPVPVLTFRAGSPPRATTLRTIVVPHDFSRHATRALKLAATLAATGGRLLVMHVVPTPGTGFPLPPAVFAAERRRLERVLADMLGGRPDLHVTFRVEMGDPYARILQGARGADAIVMSTRGRTGFPRLLIGSVAEKVVRHAGVPVLTLRPPAARAALRPRRASAGLARAARRARARGSHRLTRYGL